MIYTTKINKAITFSITTHEVDQQQKRKGKDIPYITHPLTVGLLLACAGASENVIVAGILHDAIEDSIAEKKVTPEALTAQFGGTVAQLVSSVTEQNKTLPWEDRKRIALGHIAGFSNDPLLLKSADIISNASELLDDYEQDGEKVFARFNAPKERLLKNYVLTITAIVDRWAENPFIEDLDDIRARLRAI